MVRPLTDRFDRFALADTALVIATVYVLVALVCAVTFVVMVFIPTTNGMLADAVPDATATPLTVTVEVASLVVGVTVTEAIVFGTFCV